MQITLDTFGIAGSFQPGGCVPVRISLRSELPDTTSVLISFEVPNSDGDIERYTRPVVVAPGQSISRWLYPNLPPMASADVMRSMIFTVRVHEDDGGQAGREIASTQVSASTANVTGTPVEMKEQMILVVGNGQLGLRAYQQTTSRYSFVPSLNERSIITNAGIRDLPDRWQGYAACTRIVWNDASPRELSIDQANALREWVERGGRLVIVLPEAGDPWGIGGQDRSALSEILPTSPPEVRNNVPIASLMQVLSKSGAIRNSDASMSIRLFDSEKIKEPWEPLAALPAPRDFDGMVRPPTGDSLDGAVYAIQRRYGFGWVVVLGIDADSIAKRQLQAGGLPQADVFWNRLLARRGSIPTLEAYRAYWNNEVMRGDNQNFDLGSGTYIIDEIRIGGPSAILGVLIALGIFIIYWILAGPGSYGLLKSRGLVRYSWMAFMVIAIGFTFIGLFAAWSGRALLRAEEPVRHMTFLDVIDGNETVRATSWFSAYLPGYGNTELMVPGQRNILRTWSPPPSGSLERFPNSDTFEIPTDTPNSLLIPSRATSSHFVTHWQGRLEGDWRNVPTVAETPIKQTIYPGSPNKFAIEGIIRHGLPWKIVSASVIQITPFRTPLPSYVTVDGLSYEQPGDPLPNHGLWVAIKANEWPVEKALNLAMLMGGTQEILPNGRIAGDLGLQSQLDTVFSRDMATDYRLSPFTTTNWKNYLSQIPFMYALFDMLPQPVYLKNQIGYNKADPVVHKIRWLGRETDVSAWLARPCIMVIATLEDAPSPVPLEIDGSRVDSRGTVIVRWIHELPVDGRVLPPLPRILKSFDAPAAPDRGGQ